MRITDPSITFIYIGREGTIKENRLKRPQEDWQRTYPQHDNNNNNNVRWTNLILLLLQQNTNSTNLSRSSSAPHSAWYVHVHKNLRVRTRDRKAYSSTHAQPRRPGHHRMYVSTIHTIPHLRLYTLFWTEEKTRKRHRSAVIEIRIKLPQRHELEVWAIPTPSAALSRRKWTLNQGKEESTGR